MTHAGDTSTHSLTRITPPPSFFPLVHKVDPYLIPNRAGTLVGMHQVPYWPTKYHENFGSRINSSQSHEQEENEIYTFGRLSIKTDYLCAITINKVRNVWMVWFVLILFLR